MTDPVEAARREVFEVLVHFSAPVADQARTLVDDAISRQDAEEIRREGHTWSGIVAPALFKLADEVDNARQA
ncbi:hypothetical protein [Streptomyces zhihengii]